MLAKNGGADIGFMTQCIGAGTISSDVLISTNASFSTHSLIPYGVIILKKCS